MTVVAPRRMRTGLAARLVLAVLVLLTVMSSAIVVAGSSDKNSAKAFDAIQWMSCTWENPDDTYDSGDLKGEKKYDYEPMYVHTMYEFSQTDDAEFQMFSKSGVGANGESPYANGNLLNAITGKDYTAPKLDILNNQNKTSKKYTPYDLFGFYTLKWTAYMGEWNYIKVYYCGGDGKGGDAKAPSDQKLNLFYQGRKRPLDTWTQRFASQDPRVQLKQDTIVVPWTTNFMLNIANFIFYITKLIVAISNALISLSLSDISAKFGINDITATIMKNLLGGLFVPLVAMMMAFTGCWMMITGLIHRQTRKAMGGLARSLACMFGGFIFLANPGFFLSLPNQLAMVAEYLVLSGINNTANVAGDTMCNTQATEVGYKKFNTQIWANGKFNTEAIQKGVDDAGDNISRAITCQYWRIFAFNPWVIGQYGTDYNNLWAKGHVENKGKELGNKSTYPGNAAVDLGNGQVIYNWALYQLSTQGMDHIPSSLMSADDGSIKNKPNPQLTKAEQYYSKNKLGDQINGDWYRVVDALSGWDTDQDVDGGSSGDETGSGSGGIDAALKWADETAKDQSHGYDQTNRTGPDYDCSSFVSTALKKGGFPVSIFSTSNERSELQKAGWKKVDGANLTTGDGLKSGDILWVENSSHQHTEFYVGNGKTLGAHHNENKGITGGKTGDQLAGQGGEEIGYGKIGDSPYMEAWRFGDGASITLDATNSSTDSSDSSSSSGGMSIAIKKKCDQNDDGCAEPTAYWNNWIGGNVAYRMWVALCSIAFAGVGLAGPIIMGGTVAALAISTSIIMMFAGVAFTFGMWQGKGEEVLKSWAAMVYSSFMKRVIMSALYMIMLTLMLLILKDVSTMTDYFKSILILAIVTYAIVSSRHEIVDRFSQVRWGNSFSATNAKIGHTTIGAVKAVGQTGKSMATGAAMGVHQYRKNPNLYNTLHDGNRGLGMLRAAGSGAAAGFTGQMRTYMYRSDLGREIMRTRESLRQKRIMQARGPEEGDYEYKKNSPYVCYLCGKRLSPNEAIMSASIIGRVSCPTCLPENERRAEEDFGRDWNTGQKIA